jgi:hypothetical protein
MSCAKQRKRRRAMAIVLSSSALIASLSDVVGLRCFTIQTEEAIGISMLHGGWDSFEPPAFTELCL